MSLTANITSETKTVTLITTKESSSSSSSPESSSSPSPPSSSSSLSIFDNPLFNGLGGLSHGSFFRIKDSVDTTKPPGFGQQRKQKQNQECRNKNSGNNDVGSELVLSQIKKNLTAEAFFYSPNFMWFLGAVFTYWMFPYDLESNSSSIFDAITGRLSINMFVGLTYITFWHVVLYFYDYCSRPFVPNREYKPSKVLHNLFYTILGILQWTAVEGSFLYLYRSGKLPYGSSARSMLLTLFVSIALPTYRDVHFYFIHRFIHVRCLYKYIHSLHHRNTDVEPFAGMAMHPIEHMYYFGCYGPLLVLPVVFGWTLHPFILMWLGVHLVWSPAASHSGYEDHFSADLDHYLHHRYCECNYSAGINFDSYFGTYRDTLKGEGKLLSSSASKTKLPPPPADPKSNLGNGMPEHIEYQLGTYAIVFGSLFYAYSYYNSNNIGSVEEEGKMAGATALARILPYSISLGPIIWAFILSVWSAPRSMSKRKVCLAPFDKDSNQSLMLHFGLGFVLGILPVTYLLHLVLL